MSSHDLSATIEVIKESFCSDDKVKFAYLFGSYARECPGPLSDLDIAVYLDRRLDAFKYRLKLIEEVSRITGLTFFDLITLNDAPLTLKYQIIHDGVILKEDKKRRIDFETRVLSRYLDTAYLRKTQQHYLKEQFLGRDFG